MADARPIQLAVIGAGTVFERYHLPAIASSRDVKLAAVCEPRSERLDQLTGRLLGAVTRTDAASMLDQGGLDAVLITTPPATHARLTLDALRAGCHVLVEKPMATTITDAEAMVAAAREADRVLAVGFNRRFRASYRALRELVTGDDPVAIRSARHTFVADVSQWPTVDRQAQPAMRRMVHDVASHQVDLVAWMFDRPIARTKALPQNDPRRVVSRLELADGPSVECVSGHDARYVESFEVELETGRVRVDPSGLIDTRRLRGRLAAGLGPIRAVWDAGLRRVTGQPSATASSFREQLDAWVASIRARRTLHGLASGEDGLAAARAVQSLLHALHAEADAGKNMVSEAKGL